MSSTDATAQPPAAAPCELAAARSAFLEALQAHDAKLHDLYADLSDLARKLREARLDLDVARHDFKAALEFDAALKGKGAERARPVEDSRHA